MLLFYLFHVRPFRDKVICHSIVVWSGVGSHSMVVWSGVVVTAWWCGLTTWCGLVWWSQHDVVWSDSHSMVWSGVASGKLAIFYFPTSCSGQGSHRQWCGSGYFFFKFHLHSHPTVAQGEAAGNGVEASKIFFQDSFTFTPHLTSINSQMSTHNNNARNFIFPLL